MASKLTPEALQNRLIGFGIAVCKALRRMPIDQVGIHLSRQLIRSATSPAANYAEARGAESRRDFVHKMRICLKELRETAVWLQFADGLSERKPSTLQLLRECDELTAIFVSSINTARKAKARDQTALPKSTISNLESRIV